MLIGERLEEVFLYLKQKKQIISKDEFSQKMGIPSTHLAKYFSGKLTFTVNSKNCEYLMENGINLVWLITGKGDMLLSQKKELHSFLIPLLNQSLSAGFGADLPENDEPVSMIPVPDYLRPYKKDLAALYVDGDSMEPTLSRGDLVVCDSCGWSGEGIYALRMNGNGYVKRLSARPGMLMIMSDNKQYQTIEEPITSEAVEIIGRVRCVLKKV